MTRNTCDEYLRQRYPLRQSLKDKVRRHLLSHPEFALWEDAEHNWLAGLWGWQSLGRPLTDERGDWRVASAVENGMADGRCTAS